MKVGPICKILYREKAEERERELINRLESLTPRRCRGIIEKIQHLENSKIIDDSTKKGSS